MASASGVPGTPLLRSLFISPSLLHLQAPLQRGGRVEIPPQRASAPAPAAATTRLPAQMEAPLPAPPPLQQLSSHSPSSADADWSFSEEDLQTLLGEEAPHPAPAPAPVSGAAIESQFWDSLLYPAPASASGIGLSMIPCGAPVTSSAWPGGVPSDLPTWELLQLLGVPARDPISTSVRSHINFMPSQGLPGEGDCPPRLGSPPAAMNKARLPGNLPQSPLLSLQQQQQSLQQHSPHGERRYLPKERTHSSTMLHDGQAAPKRARQLACLEAEASGSKKGVAKRMKLHIPETAPGSVGALPQDGPSLQERNSRRRGAEGVETWGHGAALAAQGDSQPAPCATKSGSMNMIMTSSTGDHSQSLLTGPSTSRGPLFGCDRPHEREHRDEAAIGFHAEQGRHEEAQGGQTTRGLPQSDIENGSANSIGNGNGISNSEPEERRDIKRKTAIEKQRRGKISEALDRLRLVSRTRGDMVSVLRQCADMLNKQNGVIAGLQREVALKSALIAVLLPAQGITHQPCFME